MTRSVIITRRDWVAQPIASISGGAWLTPYGALIDPRPQTVLAARSPDPDDTTFTVDFGAQRNNVGLFHFQRLGVTSLARMRLRAGTDPTFPATSATTFDTGIVSGWPQDKAPFSVNPWGELTVNGTYEPEEYVPLGMPRYFIPSAPVVARYVKVELFDSGAAVAAQIGCFGACEIWAPLSQGPDRGLEWRVQDESDIQTAPYGSRFFIPRGKRRRLNLGFSELGEVEYMQKVLGWLAYVGKSTPIAIVINPDDKPNVEKNAIWGTLAEDVVVSNPFFAVRNLPLSLEQLI